MYTLPDIISTLFPNKSLEEQQGLVELCLSTSEYDSATWQRVKREDLESEEVKLGLARTLYYSILRYSGVIDEIMFSLERWSDRESILFSGLSEEDQAFYQQYYLMAGWINFAWIGFARKLFLLDTRFLLLACASNIPIYINVQQHFARYISINGMKADAMLFAGNIARNQTPFGGSDKARQPLAWWIDMFNGFTASNIEGKVDEFLGNNMEVKRLPAEGVEILGKVLTLYYGLKGGFIWREIDYSDAGGVEEKEAVEGKTTDDYYLELLYQAKPEDYMMWLKDYKETAEWIFLTEKNAEFLRKLTLVLSEKTDLGNEEQVDSLMQFFHILSEKGLESIDEVLYFDESEGKFKWAEEFII